MTDPQRISAFSPITEAAAGDTLVIVDVPNVPGGTKNIVVEKINPNIEITAAEIAATVTPTNLLFDPGDPRRNGASPNATAAVNATAIQNTLDSNKEIVIHEAYIFGTTLVFPASVEVIRGECGGSLTPSASGVKFISQSGFSDLTVRDLTLQGAAGGSESSLFQLFELTNSTDINVLNVHFKNGWGNPLDYTGVSTFRIEGCSFEDCSNGPEFRGCSDGIIANNLIDGSQQTDATFKVGIALQPFNVTFGQNRNIAVVNNVIRDLANADGILAHGGHRLVVDGNVITNCSAAIDFNRFSGGTDSFIDCIISNNTCTGIGSGASYSPAAELGIHIGATAVVATGCIISGNTVRDFNNKLEANNQGGMFFIGVEDLIVSNNNVADCFELGIGFSGENSSNVNVFGNTVDNLDAAGGGDGAAFKIDGTTVVTGIIRDNIIFDCFRAFRIESTSLDLRIDSDHDESNQTNVSTGLSKCIYNGMLYATAADTTPSVKYRVRVVRFQNAGATDVTDLDDRYEGQPVILYDGNNNTTLKDVSTTGNFELSGGRDFTFTANAAIEVVFDNSQWLEVSRSVDSEVVTTTNIIIANETSTVFYLNTAGGFTSTLPAPQLGLTYKFIVSTAPTTAYIITTNAGANLLFGTFLDIVGELVYFSAQDTLNFVASTSVVGDWALFESDATNWYCTAQSGADGGITVAVT